MTRPWDPIRAVILDWAGTTVDHGSRAPARVFVEIFARRGVAITEAEARGPMGRAKRDHIAAVLALPGVIERWRAAHGRPPTEADGEGMYADFLPLQKETLAHESAVIPGVPEAVAALAARGIRVGSTTGYTRELMDVVQPLAAAGGFAPEVVICSDEVPAGRPAPWMNLAAAERLGIAPLSAIVVVDDTPVGIEAALAAGAIAVAVSRTGNALGLAEDECRRLPPPELAARLAAIERDFLTAGAHAVIPGVADLPTLIRQRERRHGDV